MGAPGRSALRAAGRLSDRTSDEALGPWLGWQAPPRWLLPILKDLPIFADDRVGGMRKLSCRPFRWRFVMHGANPASSLDTVLLMAPFAIFMILAMFGLDERLASKSGRHARRPRFCEVGPSGEGRLSD